MTGFASRADHREVARPNPGWKKTIADNRYTQPQSEPPKELPEFVGSNS